MKKALLILILTAFYFGARSQSTPVTVVNHPTVVVQGGTLTPSGTTTVTPATGSTFTTQPKAGTTVTTTPLAGSTTTVTGTVTITPTGNYTVTTSYSYVTVAATNTITAGALSVSVSNVSTDAALFNGTTLPAGATVNIDIPNAILPQYTYNCLTSVLVVLVNR